MLMVWVSFFDSAECAWFRETNSNIRVILMGLSWAGRSFINSDSVDGVEHARPYLPVWCFLEDTT